MIKDVIEKIIDEKVVLTVLPGSVIKVENETCTVTSDHDETDFFKVAFNALLENKADRLLLTPKLNSKVVIGVFPNGKDAVLLSCSEVEKVNLTIDTIVFEVDADGYLINAKEENLKEVLNDFIDEVNKIIVINGTTINKAAVTAIKGRLNKILK